jgi:hypothetical protein
MEERLMKTTYLIWKDPSCNGIDPDWQEITGKEFLALVRSAESKNRHFIKLQSTEDDGADGAIVIEATKIDYMDWKREKNHAHYVQGFGKDVSGDRFTIQTQSFLPARPVVQGCRNHPPSAL